MHEKSIAEELREIGRVMNHQKAFEDASTRNVINKWHGAVLDLATRCEGLVPLADVEKALCEVIGDRFFLFGSIEAPEERELIKEIMACLTGKEAPPCSG